jgi:hypothetical protein
MIAANHIDQVRGFEAGQPPFDDRAAVTLSIARDDAR